MQCLLPGRVSFWFLLSCLIPGRAGSWRGHGRAGSWPGGVMVTFLKVQKAGAMIVVIGEWGQHQGLTNIPIRT